MPMLNNIYPWQQSTWQQLMRMVSKNRLPHALLFIGEKGLGKRELAERFASSILCLSFSQLGEACGQCQSCHLSKIKTHPDLMRIESEQGHAIKVDSIRELTDFVNHTALLGGYRVIIIDPADSMNINASNALLKTLEEPTPNTLLILITDKNVNLPATIKSRCQKILVNRPNLKQGMDWLKQHITDQEVDLSLLLNLTNIAPLAALDNYKRGDFSLRRDFYNGLIQLNCNQADPVELAEHWQDKDLILIFSFLFSWIKDVLRLKTIRQAEVINQDFQTMLQETSAKLPLKRLLSYIEHLQQRYSMIRAGHNLNQRLLLEELFIKYRASESL